MKTLIHSAFLLLPLLLLGQNRQADSLILVEVYNQLDGPNWSNNENWLSLSPLENWNGIKTKDNRVTEINLANVGLKGNFPSAIYDLDALTKLRFFSGDIEGQLTEEVYRLQNLRELTIQNVGLTGGIPARMDSLPLLTRLDLARNELEGTLPSLPSELSKLDLWQNNLTGTIPESYADLPMWQINVSSNQLSGGIDIVENWKGLDKFNGSFNNWDEQSLPEWLDKMPELRSFQCTGCNLSGDIPEYDWDGSPKFYQLFAGSNQLSGDIGRLRLDTTDVNRSWIELTDNNFSGTLPAHLIKRVSKLNVGSNNFDAITEFSYDMLSELRLSDNNFTVGALIEHLPQVITDADVSKVIFSNQRSPYDDAELDLVEGQTLELTSDEIVDGASYQWYYNFQQIEGATSEMLTQQEIDISQEGRYWVVMTHPELVDDNGELVEFKSKETWVDVTMSTSIDNIESHIHMYPNPVTDYIYIDLEDQAATYTIHSFDGRKVQTGKIRDNSRIHTQAFIPGIYTIHLQTDLNIISRKFIKQ